jgi:hypothetical protein
MAKPRFVLRYRGDGSVPDADVARVHGLDSAVVVDQTPRMLLVESEPEPLRALVETLADWMMAPEQQYGVPDTRKQVERPPE